MVDVTLLELHVHDAEFNAPLSGARPSADEEAATDDAAGPGAAIVAGLLAVALLALLARRLVRTDHEP